MNAKIKSVVLAALASLSAGAAHAELQPFEIGGATFKVNANVDEYINFMRSSSGKKLNAVEDGAFLRSRIGFSGEKPVEDGMSIKFALEQGINIVSGQQADGNRLFDRQAWVGLKTQYGEFRAGRQNTAIFYRGNYIDFTTRTLGSVVNVFGVPSRYDADLAYISPRIAGFLFETHYAFSGTKENETTNAGVYQAAVDYENGPYRIGYAGIGSKAPSTAGEDKTVFYNNLYANYDYGKGKLYAAYVRSNNNATTGTAPNVLFNGGAPLSNVGGSTAYTAPISAGGNTYYNIYQVSADYRMTPKLRVGGLYGRIDDTSNTGKNASGWAVGGYYDVFKDTMLYALFDVIANDTNAGFRPAGSAGLPKNFTAAADVNGQTIRGMQLGFVYKF